LLALLAGLGLRLYFVRTQAHVEGDSFIYGDLALNLLKHHTYGVTEKLWIRPTLIRLPGYPLLMAGCFAIFGAEHYASLLYIQLAMDLATCWLLGALARRLMGERAGLCAMWLAALCPFTANYVAAGLTETSAIFCVALAFYALERWWERARDTAAWGVWVWPLGFSLAFAVLLRPDRLLLTLAVLPAMVWLAWRAPAKVQATAALGEICGATAFMAWCQNTLAWYVANSCNLKLASRFGDAFASGRVLGGTGLSNPMKSFFGIEKLKLKGRKVDGGYVVRGALPWVSNLGPNHFFGTIFEREDEPGMVMFLADCANPAITLTPCKPFMAMDGTGTYGVQFRDVFVPDEFILADPAGPFVKKIRAGFILLQAGMALGLIKDCINIMDEVDGALGHVNRYLPQQPQQFKELFGELERETMVLARDPYNTEDSYWRKVIALRLRAGEASVAAAHAAMLHCGARGYLKSHRVQRRLREAYFVAIVTPATKQLRKMLADA
jgi:alkylation response protein AidB-like acyl-CoA dehydrogenase